MRRTLISLSVFLAFGASSTWARPLDKIRKDALTVGVRTENPPFGYNETSDRKGLEYDLVAAIANGMGIRFRVVKISSQREGEEKLLADKLDLVIGSVKSTEELRERFSVSTPYFRTGLGILVLRSNHNVYTLSDLNNRPLAATPESNADKLIEGFIPKAKLELVRSSAEGLSMLQKGEVEAFVHDRSVLQSEVAHNQALRLLDVSLTEDNYAMLASKKSLPLMDAVNAELNKLRVGTAQDAPCPLAAMCSRYNLEFTVKPAKTSTAAQPGFGPKETPRPSAPSPQQESQDLERRLGAMERNLVEIQSSLVEIRAALKALQK